MYFRPTRSVKSYSTPVPPRARGPDGHEQGMTLPVLRTCWVLLVLLGFLGWCARVLADDARAQVVVVAGAEHGPAVTELFQAVVHARLPEVRVRYVPEGEWQRAPPPSGAPDLVFQLDTTRDSEWLLRLEYRGRVWTRTVEGGLSRDAAALEAAALMAAHTSVALLTEGAATATPEALKTWVPEAPTAPAPVAHQLPKPEVRDEPGPLGRDDFWWLALMAAYRGQVYAAEYPWVHAGKLSLLGQLPQGPCATLGAALVEPTHVDSEFGSFTLHRQEGELLAGWCFRWDRWGVSPRLGALVDFTQRSDATPAPGVGASPDQRQLGWAGVTALEGRWSAFPRLQLFLGLSAAYFLADREFVASGVSEAVLAPYRVRFSLDVGLSLGLF